MAISNLERMIDLADEFFSSRTDPDQLDVNYEVLERLRQLHPATVSDYDEGTGPLAWVLLIPTTTALMNSFLEHRISEKELYEQTPLNETYEALYLCSALVLEEYRRQGIAKRLALEAIEKIRKDHPIKALFSWAFSKEGDLGAEAIARIASLPLYKRVVNH